MAARRLIQLMEWRGAGHAIREKRLHQEPRGLPWEAVAALDGWELELPDRWDPFTDLGEMGGLHDAAVSDVVELLTIVDAGGKRRLRSSPARLVFRYAIMGDGLAWKADVPEVMLVHGANGKPKWFVRRTIVGALDGVPYEFECDGWCAKAKRPLGGAYRKQYLDPDPVDTGVARGEYEILTASLTALVEMLDGALDEHVALPSARPSRPWETGAAGPRVLPDLSAIRMGR